MDEIIAEREERLRGWFTQGRDPVHQVVDGLDIGWGGVQLWATAWIPDVQGLHLDVACGYATFLTHLGWRFPAARLVGLNIDFEGAHAMARPLLGVAAVAAGLVQADARRMPFADGSFDSVSCFLGLQDIEIGFGEQGMRSALAEAVRVLQVGGNLILLDEFPFGRFQALLERLPVQVIDQAKRALDVRWNRSVAERAITLFSQGWVAQSRIAHASVREQIYHHLRRTLALEMERQLAEQGYYVPFGPVQVVVARRLADELTSTRPGQP